MGASIRPVILKIGGSVVTDKSKPFSVRMKVVRQISEEIAAATRSGCKSLIIVHGGGSFGHPMAKEYGIHRGFSESGQLIGFVKTVQAMRRLSSIIVESLQALGVPAFPLQPSAFVVQRDGRIFTMFQAVLDRSLEAGFIPVLWGDAVLDEKRGFAILSGDQIVSHLSEVFFPLRVIFGTDVDGIYPSDPKKSKSRPFEKLTCDELEKIAMQAGESRGIDVTGGMAGKLAEIINIASRGVEVVVTNAMKKGNILQALLGKEVGTVVKPRKVDGSIE
ncbi:MAG: isopentenyl phosphate kinase [Candidatus Jordarchaeales archaeon]